jgi:type I restriction enzyme M protein
MSDVVQKLWGFCHTLRHDGIDYGDYIEQITYLLFLKMADERGIDLSRTRVTVQGEDYVIDCSWPGLAVRSGPGLTEHYAGVLRSLGEQPGLLGDIFSGAASRFNNPQNLRKLIELIDETEWIKLDVDVKAAAFEGLLEKAASEGKKGAGQYFTPRLLIQSIVRCVRPDPRAGDDFTVCDPACGTGGFLVAAYEWFMAEAGSAASPELTRRVRCGTYHGSELVPRPRRLALMNLCLHGLEPEIRLGDSIYEPPDGRTFDVIFTNPPFGTRGANQVPDREDLAITTSNKQLNFLQHVLTTLKPGGRAAVVVPDNCLFADQAGEVFRILTRDCDLHTVLRLPNGTFTPYSPGTKTNVVFFTKGNPTETVWVYDARTNVKRVTKKDRPLSASHLAAFELCFGTDPYGRSRRDPRDSFDGRWRPFSIAEVSARQFKIDSLKWLRDESLDDDEMPEPMELVDEATSELESAVAELAMIRTALEKAEGGEESPKEATVLRRVR